MYRQPENHNRVKSMKSRFEGLNNLPSNTTNDKAKRSPIRTSNAKPSFSKSNNNTNKINDKQKLKQENNNNEYQITSELKKTNTGLASQNIRTDYSKMKNEENLKSKSDKYKDDINEDKDFSDINKKELCTIPQLNLTRQLNDPSKKGCIKRTPAFRKEKFVNSKVKTNDDLNFASIVKLFESNTDKLVTCDTIDTTSVKDSASSTSDANLRSDINKINLVQKQKLSSTISHDIIQVNVHKQKLTPTLSNPETKKFTPTLVTSGIKSETTKFTSQQKQKAASSISLLLDKQIAKSNASASLRDQTKGFTTNRDKLTSAATLKITENQSITKAPLVKDLLQNFTELNKENVSESKIPEYAQVNKPKKTELTTGNTDICLTDTLKAALKQPLPSGPPPKKPPRTFAHTPNTESQTNKPTIEHSTKDEPNRIDNAFCDKLNENLAQGIKNKSPEADKKPTKIKSDPKLMLQKLENALLSNKIRSPKLPRKLKSSFESSSPKSSPKASSSHQCTTQPNIYTTETPQKNLFPNCLPSLNCASKASASNVYAKVAPAKTSASSLSTFFTEAKTRKEEPIYAEPFEFQVTEDSPKSASRIGFARPEAHDSRADTLSNSLHYMSNPVCEQSWSQGQPNQLSANNASASEASKSVSTRDGNTESLTRHKFNLIMNHTYASTTPSDSDIDSLPSTPSSEEAPSSSRRNTIKDLILNFEQNHSLEPNSLTMSSSNKPKLTVSSTKQPSEESSKEHSETESTSEEKKKFKAHLNRTLTDIRKTYVRRVCSTLKRKPEAKVDERAHLFECCLLVGLNVSNLTPYIKNKYPQDHQVPPWVEHLCFPDATEWSEKSTQTKSQDTQCYSLVITDERGGRKFGYCRRVLPEEASVCLPLTYCIISSFRATGFYHKVLQELESRHGLPFWLQNAFVRELFNCKFPQPGESVQISCLLRTLVVNSCEEMVKNKQITSPENIECVKRLVNMQDGVYGCLNKLKTENRKSDQSSDEEWIVPDKTKDENDVNDFRTPKNTYGTLNRTKSEVTNENSFAKINKYSKNFNRSISVMDSSDSLNATEDIIRPKQENSSFVHQNRDKQNVRCSEPQINKRLGKIFDEVDVKDDVENPYSDLLDFEQLRVSSGGDFSDICSSPLLNLPNNQLLHDCLLGDVVLKRPADTRLEDVDLTMLFNTLDLVTLLQTFGSLLHERKVIFVSSCLSKLSSCIEALQSILYPFSWQHTFIPVLSSKLLEIVSAPLPLIAGVLASHITETLIVEEGIAVNLDSSTAVCYMGDESDIIPKSLQRGLTDSLQLVTEATSPEDSSRNVLVSEAFVRMFVEVCGNYKQFVTVDDTGVKIFEKEAFIGSHPKKCIKLFLEWFTETAMFSCFIQSRLEGEVAENIFDQKCNSEKNTSVLLKNAKVAQKMKNLSQKLFH